MIIIRQRLFSEYPSTWQRIKRAGNAGIQGLAYGAIPGGTVGLLGGKKGAVIGALTTGIPIGAISAATSWKNSSKSSIDNENKLNAKAEAKIEKFEADAVKDPKGVFAPLADSRKKIAGYKDFEKKYDIEFPPEFYKFIKLQEGFIPIAVKWIKDNNGEGSYSWEEVIPLIAYPDWIEDAHYPEELEDPENVFEVILSDDNPEDYIAYCPKTRKFGCCAWEIRECNDTLKQAILYFVNPKIEYTDHSNKSENRAHALQSLVDLYRNYIKTRL